MARFRLFPKREVRADNTDLVNPKEWILNAFGGKTVSGKDVTQANSLKFSAVLAAVSLRASLLASFPKQVFKTTPSGKNELNDSLKRLLAYKPNGWMNAFTFWELNSLYLDLWGNAYNLIGKTGNTVTSLSPIHPQYVNVDVKDDGIIYTVSGTKTTLDGKYSPEQILHFKDLSLDGITGKSRISLAAESIGLGLAAESFGAEFFGKGGHSKGVLETEQSLGDEAFNRFSESWKKNVNHGTPLLEYGIKYKHITIPPDDAQFLATREFQVQDIARVFNIPPPLLFDLSRATFSNIEQQDIQFVKYGLRPTVERYEHEIERKLLSDKDLGVIDVRFNLDAMLRGDMATRGEFYSKAIASRWLSPNEVREKENMNGYPGGDKYENPNTSKNGSTE